MDGHDRAHWTFRGIETLILAGMWKREWVDGKLKTKPPAVEAVAAMATC